MQHIIKKQVINLTLSKEIDAFKTQHLVSEQYWREIVPMLQKTFDAISADDEIIRLDRMEIDLGVVELKDIEKSRWKEDVFKKISEQLNIAAGNFSNNKKINKQPVYLNVAEQWMFYMQHGYLPWSVLKIEESWYTKTLQAFAVDSSTINKLRLIIKNNNTARRIIFQHKENFLQALVETLTAEKQELLPQFIKEITEIILLKNDNSKIDSSFQKHRITSELWQKVLQLVAAEEKKLPAQKIALALLNKEKINKQSFEKLPAALLLKNNLVTKILKQVDEASTFTEPEKEEKKPGSEDAEDNIATKIDEEGIFVQHAGLVLLHPFLKRLFQNLELINEENFIDEPSREKALYLLHYLATGNTKPEEHELVIAKILCAWNLQKTVSDAIEFTAHELTEADDLLKEVIQQWEILKGTSVNGLREEFLQRNGMLYTKNESLYLQVESNSIDVLLDYLPWSLNIIMLPWMSDILKVEWR